MTMTNNHTQTHTHTHDAHAIFARLLQLLADECVTLGLPGAARQINDRNIGRGSRMLLEAARRAELRPDRLNSCITLYQAAHDLRGAACCPSEVALARAATRLATVVVHPLTAAAYAGLPTVFTSRDRAKTCFDEMVAAHHAWQELPQALHATTLKLLADMTWQRAMETAALLDTPMPSTNGRSDCSGMKTEPVDE